MTTGMERRLQEVETAMTDSRMERLAVLTLAHLEALGEEDIERMDSDHDFRDQQLKWVLGFWLGRRRDAMDEQDQATEVTRASVLFDHVSALYCASLEWRNRLLDAVDASVRQVRALRSAS